jgi:hypothetical protein
MSNVSAGSSALAQYEAAKRQAAMSGAANPVSPTVQPPPTVTPASVQAQQGAGQAQTQAQEPKAEAFNAPPLDIPPGATSREVLAALRKSMSTPGVNASTAQALSGLHDMIMQADKAMMQVIIDGMLI